MGVEEYVSKTVVLDVRDGAFISGQTAQNYLNAIELQYRKPIEERVTSVGDQHGPGFIVWDRKSYIRIIWGNF